MKLLDLFCCAGGVGEGYRRAAMGIDWMNREELSQAIPPNFTEYIGKQLIAEILRAIAANEI